MINSSGSGTSVFPGAGRGPRSRSRCQGCCLVLRKVTELEERIAVSSGSSFSVSDADAVTPVGLVDVVAAW